MDCNANNLKIEITNSSKFYQELSGKRSMAVYMSADGLLWHHHVF